VDALLLFCVQPNLTKDHATPLPRREMTARPSIPDFALVAIALLAVAGPCSAQTDTTAGIPPRLCWRGKPAPHCTIFWITEFGFDASMSSTATYFGGNGGGDVYRYAARDFESRVVWTVGPMFNTGPRTALGGTLSLSPLGTRYRAAVEARRRWWTTGGLALDLSAGPMRMSVLSLTGSAYRDEYGLTAGALVVGGDLINVNGRADLLVSGKRARLGTSVGVGGGSYIALVCSAALGLLIIAVISSGPWD
jgi:hypothetical protein